MKAKRLRQLVLIAFAVAATTACTEKIDLKLKDSQPRLVIEGNISDMPGPYYVILTKSKLYYEGYDFKGDSVATVIISDDAGNTDTLKQILPGLYQTNSLQGVAGRNYYLQVMTDGTIYSSSCKMPPPVDIDSIVLTEETNLRGEVKKRADILVRDPAGVPNQYRVVSFLNRGMSSGFSVHGDRLWDGKLRSFGVPHSDFHTGDTLEVQLWSIDKHIYDYFREFNQNQNNFGAPAAPANPTSVYTPDALGYFSAHSIKRKTVIIP